MTVNRVACIVTLLIGTLAMHATAADATSKSAPTTPAAIKKSPPAPAAKPTHQNADATTAESDDSDADAASKKRADVFVPTSELPEDNAFKFPVDI